MEFFNTIFASLPFRRRAADNRFEPKAAPARLAETPQKSQRAHETPARATPSRRSHAHATSGRLLLRPVAGFYSAVDNPDHLTRKVRLGKNITERIDDARTAADQHRRCVIALNGCVVRRSVSAGKILAGRQNEAATLDGDRPHRRQPGIAVIDRRRAVEFDALGIHRHAQKRHVVFPADHTADAPERGLGHANGRSITEAPDKTLQRRRHQLSVL